jgi:hypothetical protein
MFYHGPATARARRAKSHENDMSTRKRVHGTGKDYKSLCYEQC